MEAAPWWVAAVADWLFAAADWLAMAADWLAVAVGAQVVPAADWQGAAKAKAEVAARQSLVGVQRRRIGGAATAG